MKKNLKDIFVGAAKVLLAPMVGPGGTTNIYYGPGAGGEVVPSISFNYSLECYQNLDPKTFHQRLADSLKRSDEMERSGKEQFIRGVRGLFGRPAP